MASCAVEPVLSGYHWGDTKVSVQDRCPFKTYAKIKLLGRVRHIIDQQTALIMYKSLILPVFDYCDFVYYSISSNDKEILQRLQNCALKTILRVDRLARTEYIHEALNMDTLEVR